MLNLPVKNTGKGEVSLESDNMKIPAIIIFSLLALTGYSQYSPWRPVPLDSASVSDAGFIGLIRIDELNNEYIDCHIKIHFKGGMCAADYDFLLRVKNDRFDFNYGSDYLVFAKKDEDCRYYIDKDSRIIRSEESDNDIAFLRSVLPCTDPRLIESSKNSACYRDYRPVCGCDSVTYNNSCEALKKGVVIFTFGKCKK
jgi:hypothetical protein